MNDFHVGNKPPVGSSSPVKGPEGHFGAHSVEVGIGPLPLAKRSIGEMIGKPVELLRRIFSSTPTSKISVGNAFKDGKLDENFGINMRALSKHTAGQSNGTLEDFHRSQLYQYGKGGDFILMRNAVEDYKTELETIIEQFTTAIKQDKAQGGGSSSSLEKALEGYEEELRGVNIWLRSADVTVATQLFDGTPLREVADKVTVGEYLDAIGKDHPHHAQFRNVPQDTPLSKAAKGLDIAKVDVMHAMKEDALTELAEKKGLVSLLSDRIKGIDLKKDLSGAEALGVRNAFAGLDIGNLKIRGERLDISKHPEQVRGWLQTIGRKGGLTETDVNKATRALHQAAPGKNGYDKQLAFNEAAVAHKASLDKTIADLEAVQQKEKALGGKGSSGLQRGINALKAERRGINLLIAAQKNLGALSILRTNAGKIALNTCPLADTPLSRSITGAKSDPVNRLLSDANKHPDKTASLGALYKTGKLLPVYALGLLPREPRSELLEANPKAAAFFKRPAGPAPVVASAPPAVEESPPPVAAQPLPSVLKEAEIDDDLIDQDVPVKEPSPLDAQPPIEQGIDDDFLDGISHLFQEAQEDRGARVNEKLNRVVQDQGIDDIDLTDVDGLELAEQDEFVSEEVELYVPSLEDNVDDVLLDQEPQLAPIPIEVPLPKDLEADAGPNASVGIKLPSLETMHAQKAEAAAKHLVREGAYPHISETDLSTLADAYVHAENIAVALSGPAEMGDLASRALEALRVGGDPEDVLGSFLDATVSSDYSDKAFVAAYGPGMAPFLKDIPQEDKEMVENAFLEEYLPPEALSVWQDAGAAVEMVYNQEEVSMDDAIRALSAFQAATQTLVEDSESRAGVLLTKASSIEQALATKDASLGAPPPAPGAPPPPPAPPPAPVAPPPPALGTGMSSIAAGQSGLKKVAVPEQKLQNPQSDLLESIRKGTALRDTKKAIEEAQKAEPPEDVVVIDGSAFNMDLFKRGSERQEVLGEVEGGNDDWGDDGWDD